MSLKEKQFVGQRQKLLFEMESELTEELLQKLSGEPPNRFPPPGFLEQRGVITCRNAPCLKLGVRQRQRDQLHHCLKHSVLIFHHDQKF